MAQTAYINVRRYRAFCDFGGVTEEVLVDNAKALATKHNPQPRQVVFSASFSAFAKYWGFTPKACAPYRARTKGKDERGAAYVKPNAIAGCPGSRRIPI